MKQICAENLKKDLKLFANRDRAINSARFFKTGKGEYGDGDKFIGLTVPQVRKVCSEYQNISLAEIKKILSSPVHEERLAGTIILVNQYQCGKESDKEKIFKFYIVNALRFNNWDLIDASSPKIVGDHLLHRDRKVIYDLADSDSIWKKRIAILSTFTFIRNGESKDIFILSKLLFGEFHDLIHKAIGWMLREVGKNISEKELKSFLEEHKSKMSRTTLRYAIERFSEKDRKYFLAKN